MHRTLSLFFFLFSSGLTLLTPLLTPWISLQFFAPYLILMLYHRRKSQALTQAFLCGSIVDLLSSSTPLGFWALIFILTLLTLGKLKPLFFIEKPLTLAILTFLFSSLSTIFYTALANITCTKSHLSLKWVATDLVLLPGLDSAFALIFFSIPLYFLSIWLPQSKRRTNSFNLKDN